MDEALVNEKIDHLETKLTNMNNVMALTFTKNDEALILQHKEYERRLETLNHENARVLAAQNDSVSIDMFNGFVEKVNTALGDLKEFKSNLQGRMYVTMFFVSALASTFVVLVFKYIFKI